MASSKRTDVWVGVQVLAQARLAALKRTLYLDGIVLWGGGEEGGQARPGKNRGR